LGGNAKTRLIANIVLNDTHFEETMLTLRFADRAKKVKNIAKINYRNSLLKDIQQQLESLKAELSPSQIGTINQFITNQAEATIKNEDQQINQANLNENEIMIEELKNYATREKQNIERIIDLIMKRVQRIDNMIDEKRVRAGSY